MEVFITSYDYGAPLDESGRTTDVYFAIRDTIAQFVGNGSIPIPPMNTDPISISAIEIKPAVALFDILPSPTKSIASLNMEALGQSHGFILYRHIAVTSLSSKFIAGDYPHDWQLIYINQLRVGVMIHRTHIQRLSLLLKKGDVLDILVEIMARINYSPRIPGQKKSIAGLYHWLIARYGLSYSFYEVRSYEALAII